MGLFFTIFCLCWEFKHFLCSGHLEIQWRNSQSAVSQHQAPELDSSERPVGYTPTLTHTPTYGPFTLKAPGVPSPQVTRRRARLWPTVALTGCTRPYFTLCRWLESRCSGISPIISPVSHASASLSCSTSIMWRLISWRRRWMPSLPRRGEADVTENAFRIQRAIICSLPFLWRSATSPACSGCRRSTATSRRGRWTPPSTGWSLWCGTVEPSTCAWRHTTWTGSNITA